MECCFSVAVIERSGHSCWTRWRYFCLQFLRQTFVEFAGHSIPFCGWARAFYHLQRSKGKGHSAALRALTNKMDSHHLEMLAVPHAL